MNDTPTALRLHALFMALALAAWAGVPLLDVPLAPDAPRVAEAHPVGGVFEVTRGAPVQPVLDLLREVPSLGEPRVLPERGLAGETRIGAVPAAPVPIEDLVAVAEEALERPELRFVTAPEARTWGVAPALRGVVLLGGLLVVGLTLASTRSVRGLAPLTATLAGIIWLLSPLHPLVYLCLPLALALGLAMRASTVSVVAAAALGVGACFPLFSTGSTELWGIGGLFAVAVLTGAFFGPLPSEPGRVGPPAHWGTPTAFALAFIGFLTAASIAPAPAPVDLLDPIPRTATLTVSQDAVRGDVLSAVQAHGLGTVATLGPDSLAVPLVTPWVEPFFADTVEAIDPDARWDSPSVEPLRSPWLALTGFALALALVLMGSARSGREAAARLPVLLAPCVALGWGAASAPDGVWVLSLAWMPALATLGFLTASPARLAGQLLAAMSPFILLALWSPDAWYAPMGSASGVTGLAAGGIAAVVLGALGAAAAPGVLGGWPGPRVSRWVPRVAWAALVALHVDVLVLLWVSFTPPPSGTAPAVSPQREGAEVRLGPHRLVRKHGVFVLSTEGEPYETGFAAGVLADELRIRLETELFDAFTRSVPHGWARFLITRGSALLGRGLDDTLLPALREELRGDVDAAAERYAFGGASYTRKVYYHAIHDIGQALVDTPLLGCTGFAVGPDYTTDGHWRVARAFDFDGGVAFDRDKVVRVHRPADGIPFMSVAFAGIVGAVSGVNQAGIAVVVNASGSDDLPVVGSPMTLIVREILQHARTLDEAESILRSRSGFVSENVLVVDADGDRAALFEVSPAAVIRIDVDGALAMSNHFRSPHFAGHENNLHRMQELTTVPRLERAEELIAEGRGGFDQAAAAAALEDRAGVGGVSLPRGHRHALNSDIATHGVVLDASARSLWVSAYPNLSGGWVSLSLEDALEGSIEPVLERAADSDAWRAVEIRQARELLRSARRHSGDVALRLATRAQHLWPEHPESLLERGLRELERGDPSTGRALLEAARAVPVEYARDTRAIDGALGAL